MTKRRLDLLKRRSNNKADVSSVALAREFGCSDGYLRKSIRRLGIQHYKQQRSPAYTEEQIQEVKLQCRKLYDR
jgi:hypothetical protein